MLKIHTLNAFNDNYIWLLEHNNNAYVVDPGCAQSVMTFLADNPNITLKGILITHHHHDHTGGIKQLQAFSNHTLNVYGPDNSNIDGITHPVTDIAQLQHAITLEDLDVEAKVFAVPGHTLDHICYLVNDKLFCGDTLFSAGCGRLFEGSAAQMHTALTTIMQLPATTQIYCAHEYTQANIQFAQAVEPENPALNEYADWVSHQRQAGLATIPTELGLQLAVNPFLRTHLDSVQQAVCRHTGQSYCDNVSTFAQLRQWKDNF